LVVGAGIGGLVAARALRRAGLEVLVLEAHTYPGGLAGTFIHRGYRFDAGATLLSGLAPGGPMALIAEALEVRFPVEPFPEGFPLMAVHLPRGEVVRPVGREAEREAQRDFFGPRVLPFWRWQEERAKALLRFLDAQLLIASQAEAKRTYALYAALALDLPHMGPALVPGGVGRVAEALAEGLPVRYKARAERLLLGEGRALAVEVAYGGRRRGEREVVEADLFVLDVPLAPLLGLPLKVPEDAWGAFVVHGVLPFRAPPPYFRQNAREKPFAFLSLRPEGEKTAFALSLHTPLALWEGLSPEEYGRLKARWGEMALSLGEALLPGLREAELLLFGTPRTYARFAGRAWVGGFPQTHPFRFPRVRPFPNVFRVGEGVFPGQSVPAAALSGLRAARLALEALGLAGSGGEARPSFPPFP